MKIQNVIMVILCLFMTGCLSKFRVINSELKARNLMNHAAALVDSSAYHQAAKEYAMVAERYPSSSYYKLAVWKAALLNIHPANPKINYSTALHWIQVYLGLPLSPEEKETATVYGAMIERINDVQSELSALGIKKGKLISVTRKQSENIKAVTQQLKKVEAELASTQDELKKIKAVDVRMHLNKRNRIDRKSNGSVQKTSKPKNDKNLTKLPEDTDLRLQ
jgi:outer membrane protein assembly factor BamD (BamD/ComL family)